jgi:diacylglycerol kinase (ATP)
MMERLRVRAIINPSAGRQILQRTAERILQRLIAEKTVSQADVIKTGRRGDAYAAARHFVPGNFDLILAVGGDGTVSEVINGLLDGQHQTPLAILPAGTANDFAYAMKIPRGVESYCAMVRRFRTVPVDAGRAGAARFHNTVAFGLLTDVAYKVPSDAKTALGQMAYIISGAIDLPAQLYKSIPVSIRSAERSIDDDILLFIAANTQSVGGFRRLAPRASTSDGLLDILVIHKQGLFDLLPLLAQIISGDYLNNNRVSYFQTSRLEVSCRDHSLVRLDLDGEEGQVLPVTIEAIPAAFRLLVP